MRRVLRARTAWTRAAIVLAVVLVADQVTKAIVRADVRVGSEDPVLPFVSIVHVRNRGIAFSFLEDRTAIVIAFIALAIVALLWWFARHATTPWAWLPVGLLAGGAVGNVVDRLRLGAVTDFVKLPAWPAFNVADSAITVGVIALVLAIEAAARRRERAEQAATTSGEGSRGAADVA